MNRSPLYQRKMAFVNPFARLFFGVGIPVILLTVGFPFGSYSQTSQPPANSIEQQLEAITENNEDKETEDDSFLQVMQQLLKAPVNLNTNDITMLEELPFFSPAQLRNLIDYKKLFGNFISIYELQAVPGFDLQFIARIRPYIKVSIPQNMIATIAERLKGATGTLLARASQVLEKQKGFRVDPSTNDNYYPGSRQKLYIRY
ncbi:MAG: helix-hairpin-helix domain-containing protein, partial [Ferruginibacter sp.]